MTPIDVRCDGSPGGDWRCSVTLRDAGRVVSAHDVRVRAADLARLAPNARTRPAWSRRRSHSSSSASPRRASCARSS